MLTNLRKLIRTLNLGAPFSYSNFLPLILGKPRIPFTSVDSSTYVDRWMHLTDSAIIRINRNVSRQTDRSTSREKKILDPGSGKSIHPSNTHPSMAKDSTYYINGERGPFIGRNCNQISRVWPLFRLEVWGILLHLGSTCLVPVL